MICPTCTYTETNEEPDDLSNDIRGMYRTRICGIRGKSRGTVYQKSIVCLADLSNSWTHFYVPAAFA
ncbi:hypothetical protein Back11_06540 [Paenibacillus baekrokdamisoli]|uniref:Uncharacterized protein n=1 Tax=Paenibacillus baekrokdamisoli TaxID=1712516 RepID=A0A3G9J8D7_9BACL|nr:hypothetical protein Back11_06540 [Paenibacillus baekrokdamisoli]